MRLVLNTGSIEGEQHMRLECNYFSKNGHVLYNRITVANNEYQEWNMNNRNNKDKSNNIMTWHRYSLGKLVSFKLFLTIL